MNKLSMWISSHTAYRRSDNCVVAGAHFGLAYSQMEAMGRSINEAYELWPRSDGWSEHATGIPRQVPDGMIIKAYEEIDKSNS